MKLAGDVLNSLPVVDDLIKHVLDRVGQSLLIQDAQT